MSFAWGYSTRVVTLMYSATQLRPPRHQGMNRVFDSRDRRAQHASDLPGIGPSGQDLFMGAPQSCRGDEFHGAGNLLGVLHRADAAPKIKQGRHAYRPRAGILAGSFGEAANKALLECTESCVDLGA